MGGLGRFEVERCRPDWRHAAWCVVEGEQTGTSRKNWRDVGLIALLQIAISYSASAGYIATSIDINPLTLQLLSRNLNLPH